MIIISSVMAGLGGVFLFLLIIAVMGLAYGETGEDIELEQTLLFIAIGILVVGMVLAIAKSKTSVASGAIMLVTGFVTGALVLVSTALLEDADMSFSAGVMLLAPSLFFSLGGFAALVNGVSGRKG